MSTITRHLPLPLLLVGALVLGLSCQDRAPLSAYPAGGQWVPPAVLQAQAAKDHAPGLADALAVLDPLPLAEASEPAGYGGRGMSIRPPFQQYELIYQLYGTTYLAAQGLVSFLIAMPPTGPGWDLQECYDAAYGAVKRQVPANSHSLAAASWPGGYTPLSDVSDWCAVRSQPGRGGTRETLYIETDGAVQWYFALTPRDDWPTGGADGSPPAWAATTFAAGLLGGGGGGSLFAMVPGAAYRYTFVADVSHVKILIDNAGASFRWTYMGEPDNCNPADTRCYVLWDTASSGFASNLSRLNRLHTNLATVLVVGYPGPVVQDTGAGHEEPFNVLATGGVSNLAAQVAMNFSDNGLHLNSGIMRGVFAYNRDAGALVQTADLKLLGFAPSASNSGVAFFMTSGVAYPGAAAYAPDGGGMRLIPRNDIYAGVF